MMFSIPTKEAFPVVNSSTNNFVCVVIVEIVIVVLDFVIQDWNHYVRLQQSVEKLS